MVIICLQTTLPPQKDQSKIFKHWISNYSVIHPVFSTYQVLRYESLRGVPLVVLANKQDLLGALSPEVLCLNLDLRTVCEGRAWFIQPCSAATGMGLEEGFRRVIYLMKTPLKQTQEDIKIKMRSKAVRKILLCGR